MVKRIGTLAMVIFLLSFFTSGCNYFSAKKEIGNADW
jgi:predicted small secreted protein